MGKRELSPFTSKALRPSSLDDGLMGNLINYAILFLGQEHEVVRANRGTEIILGYPSEEIEGVHFPTLFRAAPAVETKWQQTIEQAQRQNSVIVSDWLQRKDGSYLYAQLEALAFRDETGAVKGHFILLRDDSEQKKVREQLKEKEHMAAIGMATAMLAHEIRNPLNGMSTTVQFLERSLQNNFDLSKEMIVSTVQDLKSEIGRLQTLLNDFHALSHPQQVHCRRVQPTELVRGLIALLLPESLQEKVTIVEQFDPDVPQISGDEDKLKQVFLNLIKNSFEAMPQGGILTAKCYPDNGNACIEIADTGQGIPLGLNVFDLFRSTKPTGTGLGLAIARQIVEAHKGSIDYSSTPGIGTTFRVVLPSKNHLT
jgi:two-component system sporulation sensor kinase A